MPGAGERLLEKTLAHLSATLEQAEQANRLSAGRWPLQLLDARVKLIGAALITIALVSSSRITILIAVLMILTTAAWLSKITWHRLALTWVSGIFFAAVVAVPAIFSSGGIHLAALLALRGEACLTCWLLVVMTTPFNRVLRALRAFHVPLVFVAILSMTFRYIFLLVATAQDMFLSRRSRIVASLSAVQSRRLLSSSTGVLLSKSIHMSDDVFHAMASRGFRGEVYLLDDFQMKTADWMVLAALIAFAALVFVVGR